MSVSEPIVADGVAVVTVDELGTDDVDAFVRTVASLVQDRDDVRHVAVRTAETDPRTVLGQLVLVLDGQARVYGKSVHLTRG